MLLRQKRLLVKKAILISSLIGIIIFAIIGVIRHVQKEVDAITAEGASVYVYGPEPQIFYDGWGTFRYTATIGSKTYPAYCANPGKNALVGTFKATILSDTENNKKIKLILFASTVNNSVTQSVMEEFFPGYSSDKKYAFTHAVIGAIYANDYTGLYDSSKTRINNIITKLGNMIENQHDAWVMAENYTLYKTDRSGTSRAGSSYQDVVWIETEGYGYGSIKVQKKDSDTQSSTPQGGASLQGITFEVYNNSGSRIYNPKTGSIYNDGALVASGTTDANGEVTFPDLVLGKYLVKETATNSSYDLTSTSSQGVTLSTNGQTATLTFYDNVKKGSIEVLKKDAELDSCNKLGKGKFTGIKFQVINNSAKPIIYNGTSIAKGSVVAEKILGASDCKATFSDLPYGSYIVKELGSSTGYINDSTAQHNVTIPTSGSSTITVSFKNQVIRGDVKFKKVNQDGQAMANIPFRITSKTTGESHIVITNSNGVVNTSASVNLHSNHTNGYDSISNFDTATYQGYGTWFGKSASSSTTAPVNDSLGALPYDTYEIVEIACSQNEKCRDIETAKQTFEIKTNTTVVDLGNWENDCSEFSLSTTATDNADGDKYVIGSTQSKIKDTISYCLKAGETYTIKGTLMDKTTGQPIMVGGAVIEKTITLTPTTDCGETTMTFTIDTSALVGHEIVVFEKAYIGDTLVVSHEDINDVAQTVVVVSLDTTAVDKADDDKLISVDGHSEIKDTISYCLKAGETYTIKGTLMDKTTGEPIMIDGQVVEEIITFTPTTDCGEVTMVFTLDTSDLVGHEIVVFEKAYIGSTLIVSHEDIDDDAQTVIVIDLTTYATDDNSEVGSKEVAAKGIVRIKDVVRYCLKAGEEFTVKGILMNKDTGEVLLINGEPVVQTVTFTPETDCGEIDMFYEFDATGLGGVTVVIFENLYQGDRLLIEHNDLENADETFYLVTPPPNTGFITRTSDGGTEHNMTFMLIIPALAAVGVYGGLRIRARRKFLNRF